MTYSGAKVVLNVFEAGEGDFFWLKYKADNNWRHVLIDSGNAAAYRDYRYVLKYIGSQKEIVEAVFFTHVDGDHIGGGVKALAGMCKEELPVIHKIVMNAIGDICVDVPQTVQLTVQQAMRLKSLWENIGLADKVVAPVLQGDLIQLSGGAVIRVISPDQKSLMQFEAMAGKKMEDGVRSPQLRRTVEEVYTHNISDYVKEEDQEDIRPENMAGIAFVFELEDIRIAFLADTNARVCAEGISSFYEKGESFSLVKLSHHGSMKNTTRELTEMVRARDFLLSTNGHGGKPSKQTLCRLLEAYDYVNLLCNYAWWDKHYGGIYFTEKDKAEYVSNGRLNRVLLTEDERDLCEGVAIRLRRHNREIVG